MTSASSFSPLSSLLNGHAHPACCACVIVPARNEEKSLPATLRALASQTSATGQPLERDSYEVILLLNNCTDSSADVARRWRSAHPELILHIVERSFPSHEAHVGTARRMLMDTAWHRLHGSPHAIKAILSTDSDTHVDRRWIANSLAALSNGADAVGGVIRLKKREFDSLAPGIQQAFRRDRRYQRLVAELEDLLDPQPGDPCPRHQQHFGASLACTTQAYAHAGGMPPVSPLEDVAFVDALRRSNAVLRHDPSVVVYTSARLEGRAEIGLSHQLRLWQDMSDQQLPHHVASAASLAHRFRTLHALRKFYYLGDTEGIAHLTYSQLAELARAKKSAPTVAHFLLEIDCDRIIRETFTGPREGPIVQINRSLSRAILHERLARLELSLTAAAAASFV